jgi:cephalosporin-C deacetylase-like acetyl esterase
LQKKLSLSNTFVKTSYLSHTNYKKIRLVIKNKLPNILPTILFSLILILFNCTKKSPEKVLDVLPENGRNELFHSYLLRKAHVIFEKRRTAIDSALTNINKLLDRQRYLRNTYKKLIGEMPEKAPLNPIVTGTLIRTGYRVEKIAFESLPNHHVTANFYIPDGKGPFPGIIIPCGHYSSSKSEPLYQDLCQLLAGKGFAALIVDPFCQGERYQFLDENGKPATRGGTTAHTLLDVGANLVGTGVVAYELWDNIRSLDYLFTRKEVDTLRIGCMGSSAGGGQATNLIVMDNRIDVAAISCYITSEERLFATLGPQDGCQNLSYEGFYGIDHGDYLTMFAPKPVIILAAIQDFFDIAGTHLTFAECRSVYDKLGYPGHIGFFEYDDTHGFSRPRRQQATKWACTWFYNDTTRITEPLQNKEHVDSLKVTPTGQVLTAFENETSVQDLNLQKAQELLSERKSFWATYSKDSCLKLVKHMLNIEKDTLAPHYEVTGSIDRHGYTIDKIKITQNSDVPIAALLFKPQNAEEKKPAVLYVDGRGKNTEAGVGHIIEHYVLDSGKIVLAIDVRGFGETTDNPSMNKTKHRNLEHRNAVISLYIGKPLIGQRVNDIQKSMKVLKTLQIIDTNMISIVGIDRAGTAVIHAAALDNSIKEIALRATDTSWVKMVSSPLDSNNMTHIVPNALTRYDLGDLLNAIAPRPVYFLEEPKVKPSGI